MGLEVTGRREEEAAGLAAERHTTAFVVGLVLGGLAGAAVTLWKTPRSGAQLRALVAERTEEVLFRLTGMDQAQTWEASRPVAPPMPVSTRQPTEAVPAAPVEEDDGATLPPTFRGEVLTEQPTDIVLEGPRPAPADR